MGEEELIQLIQHELDLFAERKQRLIARVHETEELDYVELLGEIARLSGSNISHRQEIAERLAGINNLRERLQDENDETILQEVAMAFTNGDRNTRLTAAKASNILCFCSLFNSDRYSFISRKALEALVNVKRELQRNAVENIEFAQQLVDSPFFQNLDDACCTIGRIHNLANLISTFRRVYHDERGEYPENISFTEKFSVILKTLTNPDVLPRIGEGVIVAILAHFLEHSGCFPAGEHALAHVLAHGITSVVERTYREYQRRRNN